MAKIKAAIKAGGPGSLDDRCKCGWEKGANTSGDCALCNDVIAKLPRRRMRPGMHEQEQPEKEAKGAEDVFQVEKAPRRPATATVVFTSSATADFERLQKQTLIEVAKEATARKRAAEKEAERLKKQEEKEAERQKNLKLKGDADRLLQASGFYRGQLL